jgi:hypothetical protein
MELIVELVAVLVMAFVIALAKLAATRRPKSLLAAFVKARLRTNATNMAHTATVATCWRSEASGDAQSFGDPLNLWLALS